MSVKQLKIKSLNLSGNLSTLSDLLGEQGVNIRAVCVSQETNDFSYVCIVVDDTKKAKDAFKAKGVEYTEADVLAVEMPDHPGGMNAVLKPLKEAKINVITLYPYLGRVSNPIMVIEVDNLKLAKDVLTKNWVYVWGKDLYRL